MTSEIKVDTISEQTSANGVTIDGLTIKDGNIIGDVALAGTTPTFTVGDGGAEDAALIFDGNAQDFYVALDDSADDLVIGTGSTVGSNAKMVIENGGNVGIGETAPLGNLHVKSADSGASAHASADELVIEGSANSGINILSGNSAEGGIYFGDDGDNDIGRIRYDHSNNSLDFFTNAAERMSLASNGGVIITTADNTDTLTLISTDTDSAIGPNLNLYRNAGNGADADNLSTIAFAGNDDAGNATDFARITAQIEDASNGSEDVYLYFRTITGGTERQRLGFDSTQTVFNEESVDIDFRVESDANTHAFFLEGSTGNIGIGTSSIDVITQAGGSGFRVLQIENDEGGQINLDHNDAGTGSTLGMINFNRAGETVAHIAGVTDGATDSGYINFRTQPASGALTERMRITGDGFFKFSTTGAYKATAQFHEFTNSSGSQQALYCRHLDSSNPYGLEVRFDAAAPDDNTHWAFNFSDTSAARFRVESDGDVQNHDNAYGSISDERIKQDIVDANSQWNDIKAVRVRNYKKKDDVRQYGDNAWSQIGVIAQELENVSPKLVKHSDPSPSDILSNAEFGTLYEDGDDIPEGKAIGDIKEVTEQVKSVKYSILYMKAIKALQEAMAKIEDLQARVTTLEG